MNNAYRPIGGNNTTTVRDFPRRGAHRLVSNGASRPTPDRTRGTTWLTRGKGAGLLAAASCLLLVLAAAQGYVSFRAQYAFVDHAKRAHVPSILEALGLDTGAVIFALLALSLARRGLPGTVERVLNVACALGSLTMNLLAANLTSPRSVTVWVLPSALYALASDRLIAVVRRWVLTSDPGAPVAQEGSAWRAFGGLALWLLRLIFDLPGTIAGFRRWVLTVAPVAPGIRAGHPPGGIMALPAGNSGDRSDDQRGRVAASSAASAAPAARAQIEPPPHDLLIRDLAPGEKKRDALIRLYEQCGEAGDPRYGNRAKTAELAGEFAARIGYHPGTARRELAKYLSAQPAGIAAAQLDRSNGRRSEPGRARPEPNPGTDPIPGHDPNLRSEADYDAEAVA